MKNTLILFLLLTLSVRIFSQTNTFYTTGEHLSSSLINDIYQDKQGFIWIATEYGLNLFDGNRFTTYKHNEKDSTSLCNNYVRTVFEDSKNNIWIGTMTGLMLYHRDSNSFSQILLYRGKETIYPHVSKIIERQNGEIWIATSNEGLFKIDGSMKSGTYIPSVYKLNFTHITSLLEDDDHLLWLGSETDGVIQYDPTKGVTRHIQHPDISSNNISSLAKDNKGNIYIGTFTRGLNIYNIHTQQIKRISYRNSQSPLPIKTLTFVNEKLYIGTDGKGIKVYDKTSDDIHNLYIDESLIDLTDAKVHTILYDRDQNIWLGIFQKGVMFIPGKKNPFQYYGSQSLSQSPIGKGCVMSIYQDSRNHIFVGVDNEGLYELSSDFTLLKHYTPNKEKNSISHTILSIFEDSDNQIWLGSYVNGIARFNRESGTCEYIPELKGKHIYSIEEDKQRNLYISTYGTGFYRYNLDTKELTNYSSSEGKYNIQDELPDNWINTLYCDSEGLIWIGHFKGISCFNPKKESFINFGSDNYVVKNNIGYSILESKDHTIWMGTANGLYSLDKKTKEMHRYTPQDGLDNEVICGIKEDKYGNIWLSTFNGISKYNPLLKSFVNYYSSDGLQGNEFTRGATYQSPTGRIFFGGTNGITTFIPEDIVNSMSLPAARIVSFNISGKPVNCHTLSGGKPVIHTAVCDATEFILSHHDNTFNIFFSTLQYGSTLQTYYKYRIKELDKDWESTPLGSYYITYSNLRPGKYTLEVFAVNRNTVSNISSYRIIITPPWYQSWGAYLIYALLAAGICLNIINYIHIRLRRRRDMLMMKHAEELNEAKLQFFINISHEIRTPMTLIINPLEKLIANCKDTELSKTYLMIYRNGQRILRLINQMMDIRKIDKGQMRLYFRETDMVGFINDLMLTFEQTARQKNIEFSFLHKDEKVSVWIDMNNFDKILMNLLSNAFKYTPDGGKVTITLATGEDRQLKTPLRHYVEISVTDTGIGLDEEGKEHIFDRFYQINNSITHSQGGTGVGLHLTHSLVEMHHGTITAENNQDGCGSTFTIRIPLGCDHLTMEEIDNTHEPEQKILAAAPEIKDTEVAATEEKRRKKAKTNLTLLVVDDEKEIQEYLKQELSDEYKVVTCNDGKEAYEYLFNHEVNLVVSDIMMKGMDGITLCKKIKQNTSFNHIPVILLTARNKVEEQVEGLEIEADAYIIKPFNTTVLRSHIASLLANRRILKNKFSGAQQQTDKIQKINLKSADEALIAKIMKIINENLADPNLNVEALASEVGLSRVHLHRKLKELTNLSTRDFIKNIRMQQAAELLKEKKLTISEVAYATGYSNLSHFSSTFKDTYGVTPKEYMQNNLTRENTADEAAQQDA